MVDGRVVGGLFLSRVFGWCERPSLFDEARFVVGIGVVELKKQTNNVLQKPNHSKTYKLTNT